MFNMTKLLAYAELLCGALRTRIISIIPAAATHDKSRSMTNLAASISDQRQQNAGGARV